MRYIFEALMLYVAIGSFVFGVFIMRVADGCFFEPAEDDVIDPVIGRKKGSVGFSDSYYLIFPFLILFQITLKNSCVHDVKGLINKEKDVKMPSNFTVTAYNKGGYQVIPKSDLK